MSGSRPNPTVLRALRGNPNKKPMPKGEPIPPGRGVGKPPASLTKEQVVIWNEAVANAPRGVLRRIDRSVLAAWCVAEDLHTQASLEVQRHGMVMRTNAGIKISPYLRILQHQTQIMARFADHLGFSPASRPRLATGFAAPLTPKDDDVEPESEPDADRQAGQDATGDESLDTFLARGKPN